MQKKDEEALRAASDQAEEDAFIARSRQFILRCASKCAHRYITDGDDEWAVSLIAFSEALKLYEPEKGAFLPFAELVIRRRLTDYARSQGRFAREICVSPAVFAGQAGEDGENCAALQRAVLIRTACEDGSPLRDEIEAMSAVLREYGFSFFELAACSPRTEKTRKSCAAAVRCLLDVPGLLTETRRQRALPVQAVCRVTGINRKIVERHRRYLIASVEILEGDYPRLAEYLGYIKKG